MRTNFSWTNFLNTPKGRDVPAKFPGLPRFFSSKPKETKLSREGTNFSATTPSRGRPPPHRAVSGPRKLIFVFFFLAWLNLNSENRISDMLSGFKKVLLQNLWEIIRGRIFREMIRVSARNVERDRGFYPASTSECNDLLRSLSDHHTPPKLHMLGWGGFEPRRHEAFSSLGHMFSCAHPASVPMAGKRQRDRRGRACLKGCRQHADTGAVSQDKVYPLTRQSELQAKSRSCRPKVRVTVEQTPRIRTESPRKGTRIRFRCFYRNPPPPLKAFLNPPKWYVLFFARAALEGTDPNLRLPAPFCSKTHAPSNAIISRRRQAQKKKREEIQHKEFWGPQDPPPPLRILYVDLFLYSEGKRGPNIKNLRGQGSLLGGGVWGGFCPNSLCLCSFLVPEEGVNPWKSAVFCWKSVFGGSVLHSRRAWHLSSSHPFCTGVALKSGNQALTLGQCCAQTAKTGSQTGEWAKATRPRGPARCTHHSSCQCHPSQRADVRCHHPGPSFGTESAIFGPL